MPSVYLSKFSRTGQCAIDVCIRPSLDDAYRRVFAIHYVSLTLGASACYRFFPSSLAKPVETPLAAPRGSSVLQHHVLHRWNRRMKAIANQYDVQRSQSFHVDLPALLDSHTAHFTAHPHVTYFCHFCLSHPLSRLPKPNAQPQSMPKGHLLAVVVS
jgi:hypothetical protein